jgi:hypothetical protein
MHIIRLIHPGQVDRVIAFDSLPDDLVAKCHAMSPDGFPRHWKKWLEDVGSKRTVEKWNYMKKIAYQAEEPCFYNLDYIMINQDKETWSEIVNHVRRVCDPSIRLLDKFEDMAKPLAKDSYAELSLDTEEVPIIPLGKKPEEVAPTETEIAEPLVRRKKRDEVLQT